MPGTPVDELTDIRRDLADYTRRFDAGTLYPHQAQALVHEAQAIVNMASILVAASAARVAEGQGWRKAGARTPEEWMANATGGTIGDARDALGTAERAKRQPDLDAATRNGEVSPKQAAEIGRAADADPTAAKPLIEGARKPGSSLGELKKECEKVKSAAERDPDAKQRRLRAKRHLRKRTCEDGSTELTHASTPEETAEIYAVCRAISKLLFLEDQKKGVRRTEAQRMADALLIVVRLGASGHDVTLPDTQPGGAGGHPASSAPAGTASDEPVPNDGAAPVDAGNSNHPGASATRGSADRSGGSSETGTSGGSRCSAPAGPAGSDGGPEPTTGSPPTAEPGSTTAPADTSRRPGNSTGADAAPSATTPANPTTNAAGSDVGHSPLGPERSGQPPGVPARLAGLDEPDDPPRATPEPGRSDLELLAARAVDAQIIVRIDWDAFIRGYPIAGELCEIAGIGPVPVSALTAMMESGDPFLKAVVTKGKDVHTVAHLGRRANAWQNTALDWSQPTCSVEGCHCTVGLQLDHRKDWADTKITLLRWLDRLCPQHHKLKTHHRWALVAGHGLRPFVPPTDPRHPERSEASQAS